MLLAACLLGLGGCAAGAGDDPGRTWRYAEARPDCAPWDGAATSVLLSDSALAPEARPPYLRITAYVPLPTGEVRADMETSGTGGLAAGWCERVDSCVWADRGWVRLSPRNGTIEGRYQLHLSDGQTLTGSFNAPVKTEPPVLCG